MSALSGLDRRQLHAGKAIPFVRANVFAPFIDFLDTIGAPIERRLRQARVPRPALEDAEALVPAALAYRFLALAARHEQINDLGVVVGQRASAFDLGAYGAHLQTATTVYEYIHLGTRLLGGHSSGTTIWLKPEAGVLRVNQYLTGEPGDGRCIGDLFTLIVTINTLRSLVGPDWYPGEVRLMAGAERMLGATDVFAGTRLIVGQRHTSFTIPYEMLERPVPGAAISSLTASGTVLPDDRRMPSDLKSSVEQLILSLMHDECPSVQVAAEVAGLSPRTLQRRLADAGTSYSDLVSDSRLRMAKYWLAEPAMPITEIAATLGYGDATNFARAFRRRTGLSPSVYRRICTRDGRTSRLA